jgi:glycosyltransferase involved in cell wall biosynthesis
MKEPVQLPITIGGLAGIKHSLKTGGSLVGIMGTIAPNKNQELFLRALEIARRTVPGLKGVIVGWCSNENTHYLELLKRHIVNFGLSDAVEILPFTPNPESWLRLMNVLVSASIKEGFGRTIVEAMAFGVVPIATPSGGPEQTISNGVDGIILKSFSAAEMGDTLVKVFTTPGVLDSMSRAALKTVQKYDCQAVALEYESAFARIAAKC